MLGNVDLGNLLHHTLRKKVHDSKDPSAPEIELSGAKFVNLCLICSRALWIPPYRPCKGCTIEKIFCGKIPGEPTIQFDVSNPSKQSSEFVENLLKDNETLGIKK
uniref:Uncharacterized protein n=1 Tax=Oryza brachyantha TaxID=4533 RepID=J3N241_ORYBR